MKSAVAVFENFLEDSGISLNGSAPWDIKIDPSLKNTVFSQIMQKSSIGAGESYTERLWDCECLDEMFTRILTKNYEVQLFGRFYLMFLLFFYGLRNYFFNPQKHRAYEVGQKHYDLSNDLFGQTLGDSMAYSCAYWKLDGKNAQTLDQAQTNKFELCCRKLNLHPGEKLLDIGCGWGGLLQYAATRFGIEGVGLTVSKEQYDFASRLCHNLPVKILLADFRDLAHSGPKVDKIVSVGMFEHVGPANYREYLKLASNSLKTGGSFLLHTIVTSDPYPSIDPWMERYIFPNATLPTVQSIRSATRGIFHDWDWHEFGQDYDRTLMAWWTNFQSRWNNIRQSSRGKYDDSFYRMWKYYLQSAAGSFRSGRAKLYQVLLSPNTRSPDYAAVR